MKNMKRSLRRKYMKKDKAKCEKSQIAHIKPYFQVYGKPFIYMDEITYSMHQEQDYLNGLMEYFGAMDRVRCCPTDSCNNGEGICDGSCKEWGKN